MCTKYISTLLFKASIKRQNKLLSGKNLFGILAGLWYDREGGGSVFPGIHGVSKEEQKEQKTYEK